MHKLTEKSRSPKDGKILGKKKGKSPFQIGSAIRMRRRHLHLTLKEVSERAGLSAGFLSQVERNITAPSLSSLASIANVLEVGLNYFLSTPEEVEPVTREKTRKYFSVNGSPVQYARLNREFPGSQLNSVFCRIPPGYFFERVSHVGEEFIYILSGEIFLRVGDETYDLHSGDAIHFDATIPHQWGNRGTEECLCLVVGTMPLFTTSER